MESIKKVTTIALSAIIGILIGRYILKPKVKTEVKEVIKYVEVYKEKKEEKKSRRTSITERTNKDGSKETSTVIVENDSSVTESSKETESSVVKTAKTTTGSGLTLSMLAIKDLDSRNPISYGAVVSVPVVGNLNITGMATTEKQIGIGIGINF